MSRTIFRALAWLNSRLLPSLWQRDPRTFTRMEKALIAWRYWVTTRSL